MTQEIAKISLPKVLLPTDYALGWVNNPINTDFDSTKPAIWNNFESNSSSISKADENTPDNNYTQIKLSPGKVYRLVGTVSLELEAAGVIRSTFQWHNVTKNMSIGLLGATSSERTNWTLSGSGSAIAYVTADEETIVELRSVSRADLVNQLLAGTTFEIQSFQNMKI